MHPLPIYISWKSIKNAFLMHFWSSLLGPNSADLEKKKICSDLMIPDLNCITIPLQNKI